MPHCPVEDYSGTIEDKRDGIAYWFQDRMIPRRGKIVKVGIAVDTNLGGSYGFALPVKFADGTYSVLQRAGTGSSSCLYHWDEVPGDPTGVSLNQAIRHSDQMPEVLDMGTGWRIIKVWKGDQYGEIRIGECYGKEENPDSITWKPSKRTT